ncbi:MAG: IS630 family transposase, partial [Hyphomicrobiales bacterium]|nr:IS630 family transposase [Hyphomicrobiales bacterium]
WMRIAQKRTIEEAWRYVGELVGSIKPTECANYLKNAGYASV